MGGTLFVPFDSQQLVPWQEAVTVTSARAAGDVAACVGRAGVYQQGTSEAVPSRGVAVATRIRVTLGYDDLPDWSPKVRDRVTWKGVEYTLTSVNGSEWLRFWTLDGIALAVVNDLADTGTLYRPANTPDEGWKRVSSPTAVAGASGVPCRLQPLSGAQGTQFDALVMPGRFRVYLDRQVYPEVGDTFAVGSRRFSVDGWGDAELIGRVPYLDVTETDPAPNP